MHSEMRSLFMNDKPIKTQRREYQNSSWYSKNIRLWMGDHFVGLPAYLQQKTKKQLSTLDNFVQAAQGQKVLRK